MRRFPLVTQLGVPALLFATVLLIYGKVIAFPFVLDDQLAIVENGFLHSPGNPLFFFVSDYSRGTTFGPGYFRPLMMLSFWLQGHLIGWEPGSFHLVNLILHALTAWAVFLMARALGCGGGAALVGALLFATYPPNQEVVGSIVGRCDALAAFFYLLGLRVAWLHSRGRAWTRTSGMMVFLFGFLAMLSKESGIVYGAAIPMAALFLATSARPDPAAGTEARVGNVLTRFGRRGLLLTAACLLAVVVYLILRSIAVGGVTLDPEVLARSDNPIAVLPQPQRALAAVNGTGRLLLAMIWPMQIAPPPDLLAMAWDWRSAISLLGPILLCLVLLLGIVVAWRRRSLVAVPLTLVLLNVFPVSNLLVATAGFATDRFLYLPYTAVALMAAVALQKLTDHVGRSRLLISATCAAAALLFIFGAMATRRVAAWRSEESIVRRWSRVYPDSPMVWNRLGIAAYRKGNISEARAHFERSIALDPNNPRVHELLSTVLLQTGSRMEAIRSLRRAVDLSPADPTLRIRLATALLNAEAKDEALEAARAAYALRPSFLPAREILARALFENDLYTEAAGLFTAILEIDPFDAANHHGLLLSLHRAGNWPAAETAAGTAAGRFPDNPLFDLWRARLAARRGDADAAFAHLDKAARLGAPVGTWLEQVEEFRPLRSDPRARPFQTNGGA